MNTHADNKIMFNFRKKRYISPKWHDRSAQELSEVALPLVSFVLSALNTPMDLVVSPGAQQSRSFLDSTLRLRQRIGEECARPTDIDSVREELENLSADFGRWQREQIDQLVSEFATSVQTLASTANAAVDDSSSTLYGMTDIQKSLERVHKSDDIVEIRKVVATQIDAARALIQRQRVSEQLHRQTIGERLKKTEAQLASARAASYTDHLTSIANRAAFDYYSSTTMQKTREGQGPFCVALLDVDSLKQINDNFGHAAGDQALKAMALQLNQSIGKAGLVARLSGDEFGVLYQGRSSSLHKALNSALAALQRTPVTVNSANGRNQIRVSFSAGIAGFRANSLLSTVLRSADEALYAAKGSGKNQIVVAEECVEDRQAA
ncbi:MAG: GGDEF domain-containing protein [Armatimonadetes bacterium]|nr:GGDEF domain-containing protein [Armatimonadota bacterium]